MTISSTTLQEPKLLFANGQHICPRRGISEYGVFDKSSEIRRESLIVGGVGSVGCNEALLRWLDVCSNPIDGASDARQPNLFPPFCGFNLGSGFGTKFQCTNDTLRAIKASDITGACKIASYKDRVGRVLELYFEEIKFLAQNRHVDVIVCVVPDSIYKVVYSESAVGPEETLDASVDVTGEMNFRRALKAMTMHLGKPLQLIRAASLESNKRGQQDAATKAWNFCTALYYKSGPTIPWRLMQETGRPASCALGIAFYRSRDYKNLNTSLAQIFDELGNGLILRGTPIEQGRNELEREPHLSAQQAYELFSHAMKEYRVALKNYPARVVLHKSSNFTAAEIDGFQNAGDELRIDAIDFVTVMDSKLRIFRKGLYPPFRGSFASVGDRRHILYTRGSVWYYRTYPGMYVPQPIEIRISKSEESPEYIAKEILALTKMNWNNTQFDGKYPVTLGCARKVGEILKYLTDQEIPQIRYSYYM